MTSAVLILVTLGYLAAAEEPAGEEWTVWATDLQTQQTMSGTAMVSHRMDGVDISLRLSGHAPAELHLNSDLGKLQSAPSDALETWPGQVSGGRERDAYYRALMGGAYRDGGICRHSMVLEGERIALWLGKQEKGRACIRPCWELFDPRDEDWSCPQ